MCFKYNEFFEIQEEKKYSIDDIIEIAYNYGWKEDCKYPIIFLACYSGVGGLNSAAAHLAKKKLNTVVFGALGKVWIHGDGRYYVNDTKITDFKSVILSQEEQEKRWVKYKY